MKTIYKSIYFLAFVMLFSSCEDYLERAPLDKVSEDAIAQDEGFALAYLLGTYNYMPNGYGERTSGGDAGTGYGSTSIVANLTDIAVTKSLGEWIGTWHHMVVGEMSPTTNKYGNWAYSYEGIFKVNNLLDILEESEFSPETTDVLRAEARFIRAWIYFDLARRYGAVPLITAVQDVNDPESLLLPRTPLPEIYDFINQEYTEIAEILPAASELASGNYGRATKEAAWAFNGRALLFAERFAESAAMSKKVMDAGYFVLADDYNALFQSYGGDKEVIWEMMFDGANKGHSINRVALPFGFTDDFGSQVLPTQEFVDSYEMTNGLMITDPASGYDPQDPYEGRDSRFYQTVLYHGAPFKGEVMDLINIWDAEKGEWIPTGKSAPLKTGLHTITGYYINKFMDQSAPYGIQFEQSKQSWKEMRLAEVLLNYAEAQNEAVGPDGSVYDAINQVRARAGQPDLSEGLGKEQMFERIVQERKIELALEGHRYWDLRRWNMATVVLNDRHFTGMKVGQDPNDPDNLIYETFTVDFRPKYIFREEHYLFPIPQGEIDKNPKLTQNPGYQ